MKKLLFISSLLLIIFGCSEKRSRIELIENNDLIYLTAAELKSKPVLKNDLDEIKKQIKSAFLEKITDLESQPFPIIVSYDYFVGDYRRIEKIMLATKINRNREVIRNKGSNLPENYFNEIEPEILKILENVEFTSDSTLSKFKGFLFVKISKEFQEVVTMVSFGLETTANLLSLDMTNSSLEDIYFVVVENPPGPIGGIEAIQKKITYPEIAKRAGIQGRVFVKAYIDENGNVVKSELIKGVHHILDSAAIDAVMQTKFTPGRQKGKPVKTQVSIPIVFKLADKVERESNQENDVTLNGIILDTGNLPIVGVNLFLEGTKIGGASDNHGNYILKGIPPAAYRMKVSAMGYKSKIVEVKLVAGQMNTLNIVLEKQ